MTLIVTAEAGHTGDTMATGEPKPIRGHPARTHRQAGAESPDVAAVAAQFQAWADVARVRADVAALASSPRGRHHPQEMARAQDYVSTQLEQAGWRVTRAPFQRG
jgi:uroporphyrinogen-III decarboxylase